ncbi:sensor histidine kinase [Streptomyces sp. NPDC059467]|uniref:sensor histidine kinase n=1 Tax=Streptomyces sp. NPDC059467 TaxID=3346844 RepID=UPI003673A66B
MSDDHGGRIVGAVKAHTQPEGLGRPRMPRTRAVMEAISVVLPPAACSVVAVHQLLYDHAPAGHWLLAMATIWILLLRRRAPVTVFWACWAGAMTGWALGVGPGPDFAVLVALYTVASGFGPRVSLPSAAATELGVVLVAIEVAPRGSVNDGIIILTGLAAAVFFLGTTMRAQRRYLASLEDQAQRLHRERAQREQLAAAAERTRIAREMHDIVAHGLVVVIALSEAAAATAVTDPEHARDQMLRGAAAGRESLAQMRRLLGMLRTEERADLAPQPDLRALAGLLADTRRAGLDVRLTETGPSEVRQSLGSAAQTTLYRVVQESLTNVVKHARNASHVDVELRYETDAVGFRVTDDGTPPRPAPAGNGLTGMRERVAMFDGELRAGPGPAGWSVAGRLRLREPSGMTPVLDHQERPEAHG